MSDRIYVTRPWPGTALDHLAGDFNVTIGEEWDGPDEATLHRRVAGCTAVVTMVGDRVDAALMDAAGERLRVIAQAGAGVDNIDLDAARERGIVVTNAPGVLADATADLAFALLAGVARRVVDGQRYVEAGQWTGWHPQLLLGPELHGATVGAVGYGDIGQAFARRCRGFGMRVLYNATAPKSDVTDAEWRDLDDLLAESDFVSLHVPLTEDTDGLLDAASLANMKPGSILVNTARGRIVRTDALLDALDSEHLFGAGLDVTDPEPLPADHPLLFRGNVIVTPHIGSAGQRTREALVGLAVSNLRSVLAGETPPNKVA